MIEQSPKQDHRFHYRIILTISILFILFSSIVAISAHDGSKLWQNFLAIQTSKDPLTTDFIAVGGLTACLCNILLILILDLVLLFICQPSTFGNSFFAVFMHVGFSWFGITVLNSFPIILGVYLYARFTKEAFSDFFAIAVLAPAMGPVINYLAFYFGLTPWLSYPLAFAVGLFIGFVSVPIAKNASGLHKGYTLYNQGFTSGIIVTIFVSIIRFFGYKPDQAAVLSQGEGRPVAYAYLLFSLALIAISLLHDKENLAKYKKLLQHTGLNANYTQLFGSDVSLLNMGIMGVVSFFYVLIFRGEFTGPVIGSIISVTAFASKGKHLRNSLPIMLGVSLAYILGGKDPGSTACLSACFLGSSLAPIAGDFGILAGLLAGSTHAMLLPNIVTVQAGMNLHNNGISSAVVAAFLVPIFSAARRFHQRKQA